MKTNMNKLRGVMSEQRVTQEELAVKIGVHPCTLSHKMKANGLSFTVEQMHKIIDTLHINPTDAQQIFLQ